MDLIEEITAVVDAFKGIRVSGSSSRETREGSFVGDSLANLLAWRKFRYVVERGFFMGRLYAGARALLTNS